MDPDSIQDYVLANMKAAELKAGEIWVEILTLPISEEGKEVLAKIRAEEVERERSWRDIESKTGKTIARMENETVNGMLKDIAALKESRRTDRTELVGFGIAQVLTMMLSLGYNYAANTLFLFEYNKDAVDNLKQMFQQYDGYARSIGRAAEKAIARELPQERETEKKISELEQKIQQQEDAIDKFKKESGEEK